LRWGPAGTDSDAVIVVFGIESDFNPSQGFCCATAAASNIARLIMTFIL
jgi:hypothetical protein